jgi:hypothetical protein
VSAPERIEWDLALCLSLHPSQSAHRSHQPAFFLIDVLIRWRVLRRKSEIERQVGRYKFIFKSSFNLTGEIKNRTEGRGQRLIPQKLIQFTCKGAVYIVKYSVNLMLF